jgi:hypothetical protein
VQAQSSDSEVLPLAFKNPKDGSMSIVLINTNTEVKVFPLSTPGGPSSFDLYRTSSGEDCAYIGTVDETVTLPPLSISTLVGFGAAGPSIDELPNYYLQAGSAGTVSIPLTGISEGASGPVAIIASSSYPAVVAPPEVVYSYPSATGTLNVQVNTSSPGKTTIMLQLTNGNTDAPAGFSFNEATVTFDIEVVDVITAVKKNESEEISVFPNPAKEQELVVDVGGDGRYRIDIVDSRGRSVFQASDVSGPLHVLTSGWASGVYIVTVAGQDNIVRAEKLIIP